MKKILRILIFGAFVKCQGFSAAGNTASNDFKKKTNLASSCYEQNGGCSHFCNDGICSCPNCWELNDDQKTCSISSGKATVTCSFEGVTILIKKCVVPGVDTTAIHLNDESCLAVEGDDDYLKIISPTIGGCGAEKTIEEDQLRFKNTLHLGGEVVNRIVIGRTAKIGYTCNYNYKSSATSTFTPSNDVSELTFNAGDVNHDLIDLVVPISFYQSSKYQNEVDFNKMKLQVGSTLYGQIKAPPSIPDFGFIVKTCKAKDEALFDTEVYLVDDSCPVQNGLNFRWGETTKFDVKFSFPIFIFSKSEDSATMTLSCDIEFCLTDDEDCLTDCS